MRTKTFPRVAGRVSALRQDIAAIERRGPAAERAAGGFTLGCEAIDARLGALPRDRLHELFAETAQDAGAASGFALMMAIRAAPADRAILWARLENADRRSGRLYAAGLAALGIDPGRILLALAPDEAALLRAGADGLRCAGLGAVVIEARGRCAALDLTASRRLALAVEGSGVTALVLRIDADPGPSAARIRWQVASAPSTPLEEDAPGHPAFALSLLRHPAGLSGIDWQLEWDRDRQAFATSVIGSGAAPLSGDLVPLADGRTLAAGTRVYA